MWVLADHESLFELSRLRGAAIVGLLLLAAVGMSATMIAVALGMIPRETSGGYVICGPVLHERLPDPSCRDVLATPRSVILVILIVAVAAFVGALAARGRGSAAWVEQTLG